MEISGNKYFQYRGEFFLYFVPLLYFVPQDAERTNLLRVRDASTLRELITDVPLVLGQNRKKIPKPKFSFGDSIGSKVSLIATAHP